MPKSIIVKKNRKVRAINFEKQTEGSLERSDVNSKEEAKTPGLKITRSKLMNNMQIRIQVNHGAKDLKV